MFWFFQIYLNVSIKYKKIFDQSSINLLTDVGNEKDFPDVNVNIPMKKPKGKELTKKQ